MQTIPLFRTTTVTPSAALVVAPQAQSASAASKAATIGDLTDHVGQTVDGATWAALQAECNRRYAGLWTFYATQDGDNWYVYRLEARPEDEYPANFVSHASTTEASNTSSEKDYNMKISDIPAYQSAWLKAEDLQGAARRVKIANATLEEFKDQQGKAEQKLVLAFIGKAKKLICNKSHTNALTALCGDDTDYWLGKEILLSPGVTTNGKATINIVAIPVESEDNDGF